MMNRYKKYETKDPWPEVPFHEDNQFGCIPALIGVFIVYGFCALLRWLMG